MLNVLGYMLLIVVVVGGIIWGLRESPIPDPYKRIAQGLVVIIAVVLLIYLLLDLVGGMPTVTVR